MESIKFFFKKIKNNQTFKNGILYTIFAFINNGINFFLLLILAKYLSPEGYGKLNLFTVYVTLLNIIISLSTTSYISVSFFQKNRKQLTQIILIALITSTLMLMIISILLLIYPLIFEQLIGVDIKFLWCGLLICYMTVFSNINMDLWRLEERPIAYGIYGFSYAFCNFLLTFILLFKFNEGWESRVYAWLWIIGLYFIVSNIYLFSRKYITYTLPDKKYIKETILYALPLLPHAAGYWFKTGFDRYVINYFYDPSTVGYYSLALNFAAIITMIGTAFNATNSVQIFKKLKEGFDKVKQTLKKQNNLICIFFLFITILTVIIVSFFLYFVFNKYKNSIPFVLPTCLAAYFQCIYLVWVNYLFYYKKTITIMRISIATAVIQVVSSLLLTPLSPLYTAYSSMCVFAITAYLISKSAKKALILNATK